ncbi:HNH endonuclease [Burkholderia ambifaria]|uniref:HNH endonuclease n=1 Tax=Burkholderia ambifaria TaxID=152480 RepID=UPI001FC7EE05|nr:HNH endonuclease signature motif containing protein [Burkholderia ambifaria]
MRQRRSDTVDQTLRRIPPSPNILRSFSTCRYESHPLHVDGSQLFKDNLLRLRTSFLRTNNPVWGNACAVTGCSVTRVVVASHAKPWADSTDDERLDPNNGLPLVATLDKLFDAGLIGFDPVTGVMRVSSTVGAHDRMLLGIPAPLRREPNAKQSAFLRYHLDYVFQRETESNEPPARRCFESRWSSWPRGAVDT